METKPQMQCYYEDQLEHDENNSTGYCSLRDSCIPGTVLNNLHKSFHLKHQAL